MGTYNICIYKVVDKTYTGCNLKTTESLDCALIGVCAVIRSNTAILAEVHVFASLLMWAGVPCVCMMSTTHAQWNFRDSNVMARLVWLFRIHSLVPREIFHNSSYQYKDILGRFFWFYLENVCCVYSLESPHRVHTTYLYFLNARKIIFNRLHWRYELPLAVRTTPISNKFSWSQKRSSYWSSTVLDSCEAIFCLQNLSPFATLRQFFFQA